MKRLGMIFIIVACILIAVVLCFLIPKIIEANKWTSRTTWEGSECKLADTTDYGYSMYLIEEKDKSYISNKIVEETKDTKVTNIKTESEDAKVIATAIKNNTYLINDNGVIKVFDIPGEELFDTEVYYDDYIEYDYKNNKVIGFYLRGGYYNLSTCKFGKIGFLD